MFLTANGRVKVSHAYRKGNAILFKIGYQIRGEPNKSFLQIFVLLGVCLLALGGFRLVLF